MTTTGRRLARQMPPAFFLFFLLTLPALAPAQFGAPAEPPAAAEAAADAEGEATEPQTPRPAYASARATLRTFLEAFAPVMEGGEADLVQAASCLNLAGVPPRLRDTRGPQLAVQLKDVLDRTLFVDFDAIPADPEGPPYVVLEREEGRVVLARGQERGEWRFTEGTVENLQELWLATESEEVVEGVVAARRTGALWLREQMPASLKRSFLGLEYWQWLGMALLIFLGLLLHRLVSALADSVLLRSMRRSVAGVDESLLVGATRPLGLLVMVGLWWLGLKWLNLPLQFAGIFNNALSLLVALALVWAAYRLVDVLSAFLGAKAAKTHSRFDDLLIPLVRKSLKFFVTAFGVVFIADNLDLEIGSLLAGLGLGGLAFALAAQDAVKNLFGSLTVVLDRPFQVGDWVVIGDVEGTVEELGVRSTRIRTFYNSLITMPNADLISAFVDNYGARRYRRWTTTLGVTYDTPPEKIDAFCEGIRELIRRHPYTRKDSYQVYFREFGASSLEILLYMFFETPDWNTELRERHRLGLDILRLAHGLGVDFAFPTQTLHLLRGQAPHHEPPPEGAVFRTHTRDLRQTARQQARGLVESGVGDKVPPPVVMGQEDPEEVR